MQTLRFLLESDCPTDGECAGESSQQRQPTQLQGLAELVPSPGSWPGAREGDVNQTAPPVCGVAAPQLRLLLTLMHRNH